jgi:hypothetical protein
MSTLLDRTDITDYGALALYACQSQGEIFTPGLSLVHSSIRRCTG